jgi:hypothetical protein
VLKAARLNVETTVLPSSSISRPDHYPILALIANIGESTTARHMLSELGKQRKIAELYREMSQSFIDLILGPSITLTSHPKLEKLTVHRLPRSAISITAGSKWISTSILALGRQSTHVR